MAMKQIKMIVAVVWVAAVIVVGMLLGVSAPGRLALLAAFCVLPPFGMMFLWSEPQETLSESIQGGRV
jgi:hypothetical protein